MHKLFNKELRISYVPEIWNGCDVWEQAFRRYFFLFKGGGEKKWSWRAPKLHPLFRNPGTCLSPEGSMPVPPKRPKIRESWYFEPMSHPIFERPNSPHLRTRVPTGQPSAPEPGFPHTIKCNEATRLGLHWEGMPPQCNGGLFTRRLADPQCPKDARQLACPPFQMRFRSR